MIQKTCFAISPERGNRMKIGIIGSRRCNTEADFDLVADAFEALYLPGDSIVSGGCPQGGDHFAELIAKATSIPIKLHLPDKTKLDPQIVKLNPRAAYAQIAY